MTIYPDNALVLAPLAGFTDVPYRHSARRHGCKFAFTEMVDAGSLVYGNAKTLRFLDRAEDEEWLGIQLVGSDLALLKNAVEAINQYQFDVLDFNLGCPAPKVVKKGEGAALGRIPDKAVQAFEVLVQNSKIPVTAKIRILDEQDPVPTIDLVKKLEAAGAHVVTIHGRIQQAYYSGPVHFPVIAAVKDNVSIPIIANGGVVDYKSYCCLRDKTGCDKVMLARGAMGNPWLFNQIQDAQRFQQPTAADISDELFTHVSEITDYYGVELGLRVARKTILDYMRGRGFPGELKATVSKLIKKEDFETFMAVFKKGPSERYWQWLRGNPDAERQVRKNCQVL